jgi:hypothetical protein
MNICLPVSVYRRYLSSDLVTGDLGVEGGEGYGEGLERANGVLQVHGELVFAHAAELSSVSEQIMIEE